jgi:hypothetical protein
METVGCILAIVLFAGFGIIIYLAISNAAKERDRQAQVIASLGYSPVQDTTELAKKIFPLYRNPWRKSKLELHDVYRKVTLDGDVYLFELLDMEGEDTSVTEKYAVAICSPRLSLPLCSIYPKIQEDASALGGFANKILEWGISKGGKKVEFPEFPEFNALYILTSDDDPAVVHDFLARGAARYLSQTRMLDLRCNGDLFTFSEINLNRQTNEKKDINQNVSRALEISRGLQR